ncbi:hypothetical protein ROT00_07355 [Agromyces mediolanus]|uniref:hypothetical protein n=1 Tax=Agromyces mediolanus TaxID=41986 RepID=UPI0038331878
MDVDTATRPVTTVAEDLVHSLLGLVVVSAVYADGRAHILGLPDSFFTPWHAFLYGGLTLMVVWLVVISRSAARRSNGRWPLVIPAGYRPAVAGAALFAVGGVFDMFWHIAFGVEFGIDALLSPSHLMLFAGGTLLLSGPLLASRRRVDAGSTAARVPALLAVVGITAVAAFALSFLSAFLSDAPTMPVAHEPEGTEAHYIAEGLAAAGLGSFLTTTILLVAPMVYLLRTRSWFPGAVTALVAAIAAYAGSLTGFQNPASIASALVAAALVDGLIVAIRHRLPARAVELVATATLPVLLWTGQLLTVAAAYGLGWSEEMASGVVMLSAIGGVAVVLAFGCTSRPDRA